MKMERLLFYGIIILSGAGLMLAGCAPQTVRPLSPAEKPVAEAPAADVAGEAAGKESGVSEGELADFEFASEAAESEPPEKEVDSVVKTERILVLPSVTFVDRRMLVYADKLSNWETLTGEVGELGLAERLPARWNECLASIEGIFRGYSVLMEALLVQDHPAVKEEQFVVDPWLLYQEDINFLEGGCAEVFIAGASLGGGLDGRFSDPAVKKGEEVVGRYVDEGRYAEAIDTFNQLTKSQPERTVTPQTSKMYGLALLRTGRFDMAAEVLAGALENMRPSYEERELRRLVADLQLASGNLAEARNHYRQLADYFESRRSDDRWVADQLALLAEVDVNSREFPLYLEVLKGYISFDGRHIPNGMRQRVDRMEEDFRRSPLSDQARQMLMRVEDAIREWVSGRLDQVDVLMANNNYDEAKAVLEKLLHDDFPPPVHGLIQRSMDNLLQAEMKHRREQRAITEQSLSAQWDQAMWLLDSKKYDEAIEVFKGLLHTEYDVPARANIQKAAEAAAVEMRRRSASIFVQARKEGDEARKREFLQESWRLLYGITVKYPEVRLIDKIRQNLEIIEKHIKLFDPLMLQELKTDRKFSLEGRLRTTTNDWPS